MYKTILELINKIEHEMYIINNIQGLLWNKFQQTVLSIFVYVDDLEINKSVPYYVYHHNLVKFRTKYFLFNFTNVK